PPTVTADGELCCYDVTERAITEAQNCPSNGAGGSFASTGSGVVESSSFAVTTVGTGGASCQHCGDAFNGSMQAELSLCGTSTALRKELVGCLCGEPCSLACDDNLCSGLS